MNPEGGGGPTSDQTRAVEPTTTPIPEPATTPGPPVGEQPRVPPRPQGFWNRLWRRRPEPIPGQDEDLRDFSQDEQQEAEDQENIRRGNRIVNPEIIENPNTPEELAEVLARETAVQFRERRIEERYGGGRLGRVRAFCAGERDFDLTEDGEIRRHAWQELTRKAINSVFNRQTMIAGIPLVAVGIFTGGVGVPAAAALFGAVAGRGAAEAWHSLCGGRERGLREEVARAQYRNWFRLHETAQGAQEEGIDAETRNQRLTNLVDGVAAANNEIITRETEVLGEEKVWNRRRRILTSVGAIAGLGAGIWSGFSELSKHAMTMDLHDPDKIAHLVSRVNDNWLYTYNTTAEAASAAAQGANLVPDAAGYAAHTLGESTGTVVLGAAKNLAGWTAELGGVFAGLYLGALSSRRHDEGAEVNRAQREADAARNRQEEQRLLHEQIPPPAGPEPAPQEQVAWQEQFESREKNLPQVNDIWVVNGYGIVRIVALDFAAGMAMVTAVYPDMQVANDAAGNRLENIQFTLNDILERGTRRDVLENAWRSRISDNDLIGVRPGANLIDAGGRAVPEGNDYRVTINDERREAILRRQGEEDHQASFLALAFADVRRVEPISGQPEQSRERGPRPRENQIWAVARRGQLPEKFRDLPERFVIQNVNYDANEINIYDAADRNITRTIDVDEWQEIVRFLERRGAAGGGGANQQQGQGQQGGRRGRR